MVKSVLSVAHRGLKDWLIQRLSAVILGIYFVGIMTYLIAHPGLSFFTWHEFFAQTWVKVSTLLVLISLLSHAWIGMWTIFTDYVKCFAARFFLHTFVFLMLAACLLWGLTILWSI